MRAKRCTFCFLAYCALLDFASFRFVCIAFLALLCWRCFALLCLLSIALFLPNLDWGGVASPGPTSRHPREGPCIGPAAILHFSFRFSHEMALELVYGTKSS